MKLAKRVTELAEREAALSDLSPAKLRWEELTPRMHRAPTRSVTSCPAERM
jgi:hypothetical protein